MRRTALTALLLTIACALPAAARTVQVPVDEVCAYVTGLVERQSGVPSRLLHAVSLIETGRYDKESKATSAWPWTINAEGSGQYFPTKEEAVAAVRKLQARGVKSIDVGCMQVNLMHHPNAFPTLEAAFDPVANVRYAAAFLTDLRETTQSWEQAVAHYHSATPSRGGPYRDRVLARWEKERGKPIPVAVAVAPARNATPSFAAATPARYAATAPAANALRPRPLAQSDFAPLPARRIPVAGKPVPPANVYAYTSALVRPQAWRVP
ncbi:MAG: transglycosylase SLT domain-containing protein [Rhodospirillales bacterium]